MKNINCKKLLALVLAVLMVLSIVGCTKAPADNTTGDNNTTGGGDTTVSDEKTYTYNDYLTSSPSNWNELTYQDNNDTNIMNYIGSSFFGYDFMFDENGEIVPGQYTMKYLAATALEDVSADYVGDQWGIPEGATGRAWKITLREDLTWEDGTPIKAEDFVYSMQEQLNPLFQNYRADSFYVGATVIHNAENYVKQGRIVMVDNANSAKYTVETLVKGDDGVYVAEDGTPVWFATTEELNQCSGYTVADLVDMGYLDADSYTALAALADAETGRVAITDESIALWTTLIDTEDWGHEGPENLPRYMVYDQAMPEVDFSEVGLFVGDTDYELVMVLDKPLDLLKEDGSLSYKAAYNMSSLPLVKKDLYEACKIAPDGSSDLWTSNYNSSVDTTASWGPYKLESFQLDKQYVLTRNENWYGYALEENEGLYQTDRIVCDIVNEWNAAWLKFLAGEIDGIGIDVSVADDYKGSERAYFTPGDFVGSMQLQSNGEALKARETDGVNKTLLTYVDFRKALSLALNRAEYTTKCTTASQPGYGLFGPIHYYDVANGYTYRETDYARQVLCDVYAVDTTQYANLTEAAASITGYNVEEAAALMTKAYNEALANGDIKETDKIVFTFGTNGPNENFTRNVNTVMEMWNAAAVGTPLEGRFESEIKDFSSSWSDDFKAGSYDVTFGGWTGAAWDPGYFLLAYLSPSYMYSAAWDTSAEMMTFTMKGVGENGEDITDTLSLMDWYDCLNSDGTAKYDFSSNALAEEDRLQLIAALEEAILTQYYSIPYAYQYSASMLSYKVDYITYEYNTFMSYGGMKYMTYNYDDAAWAAEVAANNNELNYK